MSQTLGQGGVEVLILCAESAEADARRVVDRLAAQGRDIELVAGADQPGALASASRGWKVARLVVIGRSHLLSELSESRLKRILRTNGIAEDTICSISLDDSGPDQVAQAIAVRLAAVEGGGAVPLAGGSHAGSSHASISQSARTVPRGKRRGVRSTVRSLTPPPIAAPHPTASGETEELSFNDLLASEEIAVEDIEEIEEAAPVLVAEVGTPGVLVEIEAEVSSQTPVEEYVSAPPYDSGPARPRTRRSQLRLPALIGGGAVLVATMAAAVLLLEPGLVEDSSETPGHAVASAPHSAPAVAKADHDSGPARVQPQLAPVAPGVEVEAQGPQEEGAETPTPLALRLPPGSIEGEVVPPADSEAGPQVAEGAPASADPESDPESELEADPEPDPESDPEPESAPAVEPGEGEAALEKAVADRRLGEHEGLYISEEYERRTTYIKAQRYCEELEVDGVGGWKLPSLGQLVSLAAARKIERRGYWSSTPGDTNGDQWMVWNGQRSRAKPFKRDWPGAHGVCVRE